ncbi:hypothetical protein [Streptomyces sp. XD-27]|uniref:hypothetical protein n=1 Tax=Streptomyces sp. XD-27 TaxID=3062779 RepID=UPI0026F46905|nr:hypothetical protein [Streptomyces sp. XD-27]WKX73637.1 hypothetical protein Q3Y56_30435 [Streptomyces sp. XD-27]
MAVTAAAAGAVLGVAPVAGAATLSDGPPNVSFENNCTVTNHGGGSGGGSGGDSTDLPRHLLPLPRHGSVGDDHISTPLNGRINHCGDSFLTQGPRDLAKWGINLAPVTR